MNDREVAELIAYLAITWPHARDHATTDAALTVRVWRDYLGNVDAADALEAVRFHGLRGDRFPPGPAELHATVVDLAARRSGTAAPTADEAYGVVMERVRRRGWYSPPGDDEPWHPAVARVVRAIGWDELCHGDVMVVRAHFMKLYDVAAREVREQTVSGLVGLSRGGPIAALDSVLRELPTVPDPPDRM